MLRADVVVERGSFTLEMAVEVGEGETLAVVGPSGAGKTTFLEAVAGVVAVDRGTVAVGGETVDDPASGTFVAPEARGIGWVPQGGGLFPHLDAAANVAFGLSSSGRGRGGGRGHGRRTARREAEAWLDAVGLGGRGRSPVGSLSGGETRRVALARALAVEPRLVLLDEPFTGLDPEARTALRRVVRDALYEQPAARVVVTHEPFDALALADRLVVVEQGGVVQAGSPADLCRAPKSRYVAELVGLNLLRGEVVEAGGRSVLQTPGGDLQVVTDVRGQAVGLVRPSAVAVYRDPPGGSPRNVVASVVSEVAPGGDRVRVRLEGRPPLVAELTTEASAALDLRPGERVYASVKATEIEVSGV